MSNRNENDWALGLATAPAGDGQGDRGTPQLTPMRKKTNVKTLWIVAIAVLCLAVAAFSVARFVDTWTKEQDQKRLDARNAPKARSTDSGHDFGTDKRLAEQEKAAAAAAVAAKLPPPSGAPAVGMAGTPAIAPANGNGPDGGMQGGTRPSTQVTAASGPRVETPAERRLAGEVYVSTGLATSNGRQAGATTAPAAPASPAQLNGSSAGGQGGVRTAGSLEDRLTPSTLASVVPNRLPNLDYLLKRGTTIPCGTRTKIVTTYPGMTSCIVSKDVYSANGKTLLLRAGSEVTGEQRSALLQGQARIFVLWSRIDLSDGGSVALNSPGADALGASGHEAYVDTHFWQRFGGALLVSLVSDFGSALSSKSVGSGDSQISFSSTASSTQSLTTETLRNSISIPPTAYSNQGSQINIFVARDVDFSQTYELVQ
ncbi:type IV secretion system protein VirB10 [Cupriavidus sp. CP313]